jgi:hypothetical protein
MDMLAIEATYRDHQYYMAWVNREGWKFETPAKRHPVRQAVAKRLIALATMLTATAKQETQAA